MAREDEWISPAQAEDLISHALQASGAASSTAKSVARALTAAEVDGQSGHGFSRVAAYCAQARSGKVDAAAIPAASMAGDAFMRIDAGNGFAFPALDLATQLLPSLAAKTGIAGAGVYRSHHCGQLGAHVERLAERGVAALMFANTPKAIAPWGGAEAFFGTNPIAFAAPMANGAPLVIDLSLSKVARGKVMAAAKEGAKIPQGWALDAQGAPTTNPQAALQGTMIPMGDAKGAALALMVEVLAASLLGASPSHKASSFFEAQGAPPGVGQLLIAFSPARICADDGFTTRLAELLGAMAGQQGVRVPGTRRLAAREQALAKGVKISAKIKAEIEKIVDDG